MMNWIAPSLHECVKLLSRIPSATIKVNLVPTRTLSFGRKYSRAAVSVLAFVGVTFSGYKLHLNAATAVLLCLLIVVWQSLGNGFALSAIVSLVGAACLDFFFLPPLLSLRIADPFNILTFFVFLAVALVITHLVSRVRAEAERTVRRNMNLEQLHEASRRLLLAKPDRISAALLVETFGDVFTASAVCLFDAETAEIYSHGTPRCDLAERTRQAYFHNADSDDLAAGVVVRCLRAGSALRGVIGFEGLRDSDRIIGPLSVLAAAALEQACSFRKSSDEAAATQAEVFRTAILDALAHEFKTPLATILAVVGGLRESERLQVDELEMAGIIESETARLSTLTARLLQLARLDREEVRPRIKSTNILALVELIASRYASQFSERRISVSCPSPCIKAPADRELLDLAITQLLDNALKYSIPDSAVTLQITKEEESVMIRVRNEEGNFIAPGEQERIFERFYRGTDVRKLISGAGLGLYVARKIVVAHGGSLVLDKSTSAGTVVFSVKLPMSTNESYHVPINI
jgi:two-component system, OmpR family, sensor histidine kinase KdpD